MLVTGSTAWALFKSGITPKDIDLVGTYDEAMDFRKRFKAKVCYPINAGKTIFMKNAEGKIAEVEIAWPDSRAERLLDFAQFRGGAAVYQMGNPLMEGYLYASPNLLYLLKMSHRYLKNSPHFKKTMDDIWTLRNDGCEIPAHWLEFLKEREKETYTYSHPKLDTTKGEFFDSAMTGVPQKYDHDSIHEAVALYGKPAYEFYKQDESEVACSEELFYNQPRHIQLAGVLEESYVLALERSLVPFPGGKTPEEAFEVALMKVCTSITSGWFREFAWENYYDVLDLFHETEEVMPFVDQFKWGVAKGTVRLKQT